MSAEPTVSIIIATYNRSGVLYYAIASVLQSDFSDFELIVVGDGCTDDTEAIVRGFADPRIRFVNLPSNSGAQSAPNNAGVALARGRYILFLNHDDFYFSDHISASLDFMEREGADIAWSPVLLLQKSGLAAGPPDPVHDVLILDGAVADGRFDPRAFIIASSWVVRAEVCRAVGLWRAPDTTRLSPSQEWLFRAHRQGRRLAYHRHVSVLCIHAGVRRHSYVIRHSADHERAWSWIAAGTQMRDALMECAALVQAGGLRLQHDELQRLRAEGQFPRLRHLAAKALRCVGIHPVAVERFLLRHGKGEWIARIRKFTAEAPEIVCGQTLPFGDSAVDPYLGRGWSPPDTTGLWTAGSHAEVIFSVAVEECVLELSGHPRRLSDRVVFGLNGTPVLTCHFDKVDTVTRLPLPGPGTFWFTIDVESSTVTPSNRPASPDMADADFWMSWLRVVGK